MLRETYFGTVLLFCKFIICLLGNKNYKMPETAEGLHCLGYIYVYQTISKENQSYLVITTGKNFYESKEIQN